MCKDKNAHNNLNGNPKQKDQLWIPRFRLHNIIKMGVSETECELLSVVRVLREVFLNTVTTSCVPYETGLL